MSKFKVTSRKLTAFRLASIVIFSPMVLNISIMPFLVLSAFDPLVLSITANPSSLYRPIFCLGTKDQACPNIVL